MKLRLVTETKKKKIYKTNKRITATKNCKNYIVGSTLRISTILFYISSLIYPTSKKREGKTKKTIFQHWLRWFLFHNNNNKIYILHSPTCLRPVSHITYFFLTIYHLSAVS